MSSSSPSPARLGPDRAVTVGVDFGTLSGRALVVRVSDGAELADAVHPYPHGSIERALPVRSAANRKLPPVRSAANRKLPPAQSAANRKLPPAQSAANRKLPPVRSAANRKLPPAHGAALPPDWALQLPSDWIDVLKNAVPKAVAAAGVEPGDVIGIATDFTASTVLPTLADGTPLCELTEWATRPHAYPKLWKHHAAQGQAERITAVAAARGESWLARYGGRISSEWEFAKALQLLEEDPEVYARTERWVEAADWIVWQLCGTYLRNACVVGYKGIHQDGRHPGTDFLAALNPAFADFVSAKLEHPIGQLGERAGGLTAQAAAWTGLPEGIAVAVGNLDAHATAPAAQAVEPGQMVAIMGTSTCHVMVSDRLREVPGMCGVVDGGIVTGRWGYEAGQSGVGDIFGWFVDTAVPPGYHDLAAERGLDVHELLTELAAEQEIGQHGLVALDWHSGNRSVLVDHQLSGMIVGQTLATRPEDTYRALLEATAFGTRTIIETFERAGVPVAELIIAGGLVKNRLLMQIYADVCNRPLSIIGSEQGPALGSAIHAAVAAGRYPDVRAAAAAMGKVDRGVYQPDPARAGSYDALFVEYTALHDHFGRGANDVMHRLRALRAAALARSAPTRTAPSRENHA